MMIGLSNLTRIEYIILGTLLNEPECVGEVVANLAPEDFSMLATRGLFDAISALHFRGAPVEPVTVLQEAGQDYEAVVRDVLDLSTAASNVPYYCDLLRESGKLRQIQTEAVAITAAETLGEARDHLDRMNGLMVTKKSVKIINASQAALDFYGRQESQDKPEYFTWGIRELDESLCAELGDFIVVGGYPSSGKTLLSLQFAAGLATKYRVGYFSLETSPRKLTDRLMSHLSKVPLVRIKRRDLNEADWAALAETGARLATLQLDFIDAAGMSVRDVQAVSLNKRYQVVVVDYLQLLTDGAKGRYEQVTNVSQGLHTMARSNAMAVLALAQLSRPDKIQGKPQPPSMSSFRESGQIEQDADIALLLWPSDPNDNRSHRILKVGKNKDGERLKLELEFDGATQTMKVAEMTQGEKYRKIHREIKEAARAASAQVTFTELKGDDPELPF